MATKIENELLKATGLKKAASESNPAYLERLTRGVSQVDDKVWEDLSTEAQKWANSAIDAIRDKKPLPPFPDAEPEEEPGEEEEAAPRRRATRSDDEEEPAPKRKADKDDEEEDPPAPRRNKDAEADDEPAEEDPPARAGKKEKDMKKKNQRATVDDEPTEEAPEAATKSGKGKGGGKAKAEEKAEKPAKKKASGSGGGVELTRKIVIKHPNKSLEAVTAEVQAKHPETSPGTIQATRSMTRATLRLIPEYADKVK